MTVIQGLTFCFHQEVKITLFFLYFHFIFLIERLWNMLALSLSQSRDPDTGENSLTTTMDWHQICIFALQSVFVWGMCNIGKNPCLLQRQAQMNAIFFSKVFTGEWFVYKYILLYYVLLSFLITIYTFELRLKYSIYISKQRFQLLRALDLQKFLWILYAHLWFFTWLDKNRNLSVQTCSLHVG